MKLLRKFATVIAVAMGMVTVQTLPVSAQTFTQYVNPYIGTGGHGHVFLGANVPFGFVQLGPTEPARELISKVAHAPTKKFKVVHCRCNEER